jgi:hypothetical protein
LKQKANKKDDSERIHETQIGCYQIDFVTKLYPIGVLDDIELNVIPRVLGGGATAIESVGVKVKVTSEVLLR